MIELRSCTFYPPAGRDPGEYTKAVQDAAQFIAIELGDVTPRVHAASEWHGDRFMIGWRIYFFDHGGRLPKTDRALADLVARRVEREWCYLNFDEGSEEGTETRIAAVLGRLAPRV